MGEVFSRCKGSKVRLKTINMELLYDTSVEVTTGNIVLDMLEHFIGTAVRCSELCWQEILVGATDNVFFFIIWSNEI